MNPLHSAFTEPDLPPDLQIAGKANGLSKDKDAHLAVSDRQFADVIAYIKTLAK